jgi:hypothetical protein
MRQAQKNNRGGYEYDYGHYENARYGKNANSYGSHEIATADVTGAKQ